MLAPVESAGGWQGTGHRAGHGRPGRPALCPVVLALSAHKNSGLAFSNPGEQKHLAAGRFPFFLYPVNTRSTIEIRFLPRLFAGALSRLDAHAAHLQQWCCVAAARWFLLHQGVGAVSSSVLPRKRWAGAAVSPHFASERGARRARGLCPSACWRCRACWRIGMHAHTDGQSSQFSFARAPLHASRISA